MRVLLLVFTIFLSGFIAKGQKDYLIQLNDTLIEVALDKEYKLRINGEDLSFIIKAKDTLMYNTNLYSFKYLRDYMVTKVKIDEGIEQIMLITAEGSGIIIQEYSTINPTTLNEMMISEMTKESISYGFEMKTDDYSRELKSGHKLDVDKAVLKYKDETNIIEVASIGNKDEGIMIITMIMDVNFSQQGRGIIDLMWNSLIYK